MYVYLHGYTYTVVCYSPQNGSSALHTISVLRLTYVMDILRNVTKQEVCNKYGPGTLDV